MLLRGDVLRFALEQIVGEQLLLYILKAQTRNRIGKASPVIPCSRNRRIAFSTIFSTSSLSVKDLLEIASSCNLLAPSSADINAVAAGIFLKRLKRTFPEAASAVVADRLVDDNFSIRN